MTRAGALLRRLHDAGPARPPTDAHRAHGAQRVERLLADCRPVLTARELDFVRAQADLVAQVPLDHEVPCHGDYRAHNWLVDGSGTLRVIDFGKSRWGTVAWDLGKLFLRPWWRRPQLAAAFLDGYGRRLLPEEAASIQGRMAIDALAHAAFGVTRGSDRHVRFGRSRLADLLTGHEVVAAPLREV